MRRILRSRPEIVTRAITATFKDIAGQRFGKIVALSHIGFKAGQGAIWRCLCDCGNIANMRGAALTTGQTTSCGCVGREKTAAMGRLKRTHGMSRTPIYNVWFGMKSRCLDPDDPAYERYGGRGITVSEQWMIFENFYADMGKRPEGLSLERKDNNLGYSRSNCKWATPKEQSNNRRTNVLVTFNGATHNIAEWSEIVGIAKGTLWKRLNEGWDIEDALTITPAPGGNYLNRKKKI